MGRYYTRKVYKDHRNVQIPTKIVLLVDVYNIGMHKTMKKYNIYYEKLIQWLEKSELPTTKSEILRTYDLAFMQSITKQLYGDEPIATTYL